jgi:hypothetical protein
MLGLLKIDDDGKEGTHQVAENKSPASPVEIIQHYYKKRDIENLLKLADAMLQSDGLLSY